MFLKQQEPKSFIKSELPSSKLSIYQDFLVVRTLRRGFFTLTNNSHVTKYFAIQSQKGNL